MSDEEATAADSVSAVLRLRGLPFTSTEDDLKEFFNEYSLQQIFLCKRNGRANGEAYVQLDTADAAKEALQTLNRKHMGKRYIEIFEAQPSDLLAVKTLSAESRAKGYVVRLRGLPYSASSADLVKFFDGLDIVRGVDGVLFTYTPDGRPTGEAYVEFDNEDAHKEAMKRHKELIGTRYIELFVSSKADMYQAMQHNKYVSQTNKKRWLMHGGMMDASGVRHLGPYGQGVDEMTEFFRGFSITPRTVPMVPRFGPSPGDHVAAMQGTPMGYMQMDGLDERGQQRGKYMNIPSSSPNRRQSPVPTTSRGLVQQHMPVQAYVQGFGPKGMQGGARMGGQMPQQMMTDYNAQQQMMMQQQYMMQQQMMQQQQVAWGGVGNMPAGAMGAAAPGVAGSWYKGYATPAYGVSAAPQGYGGHGGYGMAMAVTSHGQPGMGLDDMPRHGGSPRPLDVSVATDQSPADVVDPSGPNRHGSF